MSPVVSLDIQLFDNKHTPLDVQHILHKNRCIKHTTRKEHV